MGKGWLGAPLIKKRLRKVQKIEVRNARELAGGSRGSLNKVGVNPSLKKGNVASYASHY